MARIRPAPGPERRLPGLSIPLLTVLMAGRLLPSFAETECAPGAQPIYWYCDSSAAPLESPGTCERVSQWLSGALPGIGYCLRPQAPANGADSQAMVIVLRGERASSSAAEAVVTLARAREFGSGLRAERSRALVELAFTGEDRAAFEAVLASKIVENLRASYVCNFNIDSKPDSVQVSTSTGLSGTTPLEWVVPLGPISIRASKKDYLSVSRDIELAEAGMHTYHIDLRKRRFFHSKLMVPTAALAVAAGACYALDRHYYSKYQSLGEVDYIQNPGSFEETWTTAKAFEYASQACVGLAGVCLALSFRF